MADEERTESALEAAYKKWAEGPKGEGLRPRRAKPRTEAERVALMQCAAIIAAPVLWHDRQPIPTDEADSRIAWACLVAEEIEARINESERIGRPNADSKS